MRLFVIALLGATSVMAAEDVLPTTALPTTSTPTTPSTVTTVPVPSNGPTNVPTNTTNGTTISPTTGAPVPCNDSSSGSGSLYCPNVTTTTPTPIPTTPKTAAPTPVSTAVPSQASTRPAYIFTFSTYLDFDTPIWPDYMLVGMWNKTVAQVLQVDYLWTSAQVLSITNRTDGIRNFTRVDMQCDVYLTSGARITTVFNEAVTYSALTYLQGNYTQFYFAQTGKKANVTASLIHHVYGNYSDDLFANAAKFNVTLQMSEVTLQAHVNASTYALIANYIQTLNLATDQYVMYELKLSNNGMNSTEILGSGSTAVSLSVLYEIVPGTPNGNLSFTTPNNGDIAYVLADQDHTVYDGSKFFSSSVSYLAAVAPADTSAGNSSLGTILIATFGAAIVVIIGLVVARIHKKRTYKMDIDNILPPGDFGITLPKKYDGPKLSIVYSLGNSECGSDIDEELAEIKMEQIRRERELRELEVQQRQYAEFLQAAQGKGNSSSKFRHSAVSRIPSSINTRSAPAPYPERIESPEIGTPSSERFTFELTHDDNVTMAIM